MSKKPVMLCIMDGFGWTPDKTFGNAVAAANKPNLDKLFANYPMTTIEASGIAISCMTARHFNVPVVFAKKAKSKNIDGDVYTSTVHSYTYGRDYDITLAKKFLSPADKVLILDDFLANGKAMKGLLDVCAQAGATVGGIGICIEKGFQPGGAELRAAGYKLASLAIVDTMSDDQLTFREQ